MVSLNRLPVKGEPSNSHHYSKGGPSVQIIATGANDVYEISVETVVAEPPSPSSSKRRVAFAKGTLKATNGLSIWNGVNYWSAEGSPQLLFPTKEIGEDDATSLLTPNNNEEDRADSVVVIDGGISPKNADKVNMIDRVPRDISQGSVHNSTPLGTCGHRRGRKWKGSSVGSSASRKTCFVCLHIRASNHFEKSEYDECIRILSKIMHYHVLKYGRRSKHVASDLHNISIVLVREGLYERALSVCEEAVEVRRDVLGKNHPDFAASMVEKGIILLSLESFDPALENFNAALSIRREVFGSKDPLVADVLNNIGCVYMELGELDHAVNAYLESLEIKKKNASEVSHEEAESHILSMAALQCNIGCIMLKRKQYENAAAMFEETLLIQRSVLGEIHPSVLIVLDRLGYSYAMIKNHNVALKTFEDLLRCQNTMFGNDHIFCTHTLRKICNLKIKAQDFNSALSSLRVLSHLQEKILAPDDLDLIRTKRVMRKMTHIMSKSMSIYYSDSDEESTVNMLEEITSNFPCSCHDRVCGK